MSVNNLYPTVRPSLDLNFAGSRTVDPRITFSRSGTGNIASYFNEKGVMQFAPANTPRIDFDPATLECKGLLIEEQRTNLLTYSEQFDNTDWVKAGATITTNATVAPNKTSTAAKLVERAVENATHIIYPNIGYSATSTTVTASIFAKAAERYIITLEISNFLNDSALCKFNLYSGTPSTAVSTGSDYTMVSASMLDVGNGWFRCSITATKGTQNAVNRFVISTNNGTSNSYTGDGVSGIYIWGAQLEQGSFPTSYIPTTSAQVTRGADFASMQGANFSSWYRQDECTLFAEASGAKTRFIACIDDGTALNRLQVAIGSNSAFEFYSVVAGSATISFAGGTSPTSEFTKAKFSYGIKSGSTLASVNGTLPFGSTPSTGAVLNSLSNLRIGSNWAGGNSLCGHIRCIAVYTKRVTDQQLQAMTA